MTGLVDNLIEQIIGSIIGGVAGLLIARLMFYDGTKLNFLKCKGALD